MISHKYRKGYIPSAEVSTNRVFFKKSRRSSLYVRVPTRKLVIKKSGQN
uniref:Uncharacterized protein n=1 Tax=Arundo donax TaxID=35708 RepID=A0A0A8YDK2_ARUDO